MNQEDRLYDIRSTELARETLSQLTNVPFDVWRKRYKEIDEYLYSEAFIEDIIVSEKGQLLERCDNWIFNVLHITTSANGCNSIKKNGLLSLQKACLLETSELYEFLSNHEIVIDLDSQVLHYGTAKHNISFGGGIAPRYDEEYYEWAIARKLYYDYAVCGFLSIWERSPYGGSVHLRPEILNDIDNLLHTHLSLEWRDTHDQYEVLFEVKGRDIVQDESKKPQEKVLGYIKKALENALSEPGENDIILKNDVCVPPENILSINQSNYWGSM